MEPKASHSACTVYIFNVFTMFPYTLTLSHLLCSKVRVSQFVQKRNLKIQNNKNTSTSLKLVFLHLKLDGSQL